MLNPRNIAIVGFGNSTTEAVVGIREENRRWLNILNQNLAEYFKPFDSCQTNNGVKAYFAITASLTGVTRCGVMVLFWPHTNYRQDGGLLAGTGDGIHTVCEAGCRAAADAIRALLSIHEWSGVNSI